jgi:predicted porin
MKKLALLLATVGALGPVAAQAQSNTSVYGRIDLSVDFVRATESQIKQQDNASRLGFRGVEDLGGGLAAVYGAEFGFGADTGGFASTINQFRNTYVGLTGGFGKFAMGRLDSANPTGSPLYSQITRNIDFVIHDAGAPALTALNNRNRVSNAFGYMSPTFNGFDVRARHYFQGPTPSAAPGPGVVNEDDFKSTDIGLNYEQGPFAAGIGYGKDTKRGGYLANDFKSKWQATASYNFNVVKAYAFYGRDSFNAAVGRRDTVNYWLVGASAPIGDSNKIVANYLTKDVQSDPAGRMKDYQIGFSHQLSKRTQLYALYVWLNDNDHVANSVTRTFSTGIQHNF